MDEEQPSTSIPPHPSTLAHAKKVKQKGGKFSSERKELK